MGDILRRGRCCCAGVSKTTIFCANTLLFIEDDTERDYNIGCAFFAPFSVWRNDRRRAVYHCSAATLRNLSWLTLSYYAATDLPVK